MRPVDGAPPIEITALERSFGERRVLDGIDLRVERGQRVAVVGPNGSGKTTLLRIIAGTVAPERGSVRLLGEPPTVPAARRALGVAIGDHRSFYRRLSVEENLVLFARLKLGRREVKEEVGTLLDELDLIAHASIATGRCSSGTLQRLALARALVGTPAALLLDEPTRSMDAGAREMAWAAIGRRDQAAVIVATHSEDEARAANRTLELGAP